MPTSAQLPLCVYCGTERPADHSRCATCGRAWIDIRVGSADRIPVAAAVGASVDTGRRSSVAVADVPPADDLEDPDEFLAGWDPWSVPTEKESDRMRWLVPAVLAGAVVLVYGLIFFGFLDGAPATSAPAAAPESTVVTSTTAATPTTEAPTTTQAPPATTSTTVATPTTVAVDYASLFTASGEAVALNNISLRATSIGPIEFGTPAAEAAGRLIASLRDPEAGGVAGVELGLCEGETGFWLRWSELTAVFRGSPEDGTFVGYRYEVPTGPATSHLEIATLSGVTLGDTVPDLESTYSQFTIRYEDLDGTPHFSVLEEDQLLLWGPLTAIGPSGQIAGIYSPDVCATA